MRFSSCPKMVAFVPGCEGRRNAIFRIGHVHQFTCQQACQLYIYSDVPFDIRYVNAKGDEISPSEAMKAFKQTVATVMK